MFLCYCGTDNRNEVVLQWLKAEYGVIMWPIKFEQKTMIKLADASIVHVTKENIEQITWFSSKLYFEPETQDKNLRQFSIEIPRESCEVWLLAMVILCTRITMQLYPTFIMKRGWRWKDYR